MQEPVKQQSLEVEYKKTGIRPEDIAVLRQWALTQPHLPANFITELDLVLAYHSCDQSIEVAKQVLDLNLTLRTLFTNLFKDRRVDENVLETVKSFILVRLEVPDNLYKIAYCRIRAVPCDVTDIVRLAIMQFDLWQYEEGTWPGFILIIDLKEYTVAHLAKVNLQAVRNIFYYLQEAICMKIKGLHIINSPSITEKLMSIFRPFLKKELLEIFHVHLSGDALKDFSIPINALPKDAGGQFKSFEEMRSDIVNSLVANKNFFNEENKKRVNEKLRPGKPTTLVDIFGGVEGSFKKLDID